MIKLQEIVRTDRRPEGEKDGHRLFYRILSATAGGSRKDSNFLKKKNNRKIQYKVSLFILLKELKTILIQKNKFLPYVSGNVILNDRTNDRKLHFLQKNSQFVNGHASLDIC